MPRRDLTWIPRLLGAATAAYGAAVAAKPDVLLSPTKLSGGGRTPSAGTTLLARAVGGRDLASGLAMALAPVLAHVEQDVGDHIANLGAAAIGTYALALNFGFQPQLVELRGETLDDGRVILTPHHARRVGLIAEQRLEPCLGSVRREVLGRSARGERARGL